MAETSARAPGSTEGARRPGRGAAWLLLLPLIGTLIPEIYNRSTPSIGGMPFFYWYQFAWIAGSVACTWIVYRATRGAR